MSMATYAPRPKRQGGNGDGAEWTEEQKHAYTQQWDNFRVKMAKRSRGQTRDFDATVLLISEPFDEDKEFKGVTTKRRARTIKVQLAEPGLDMLRWQENSADNPFNDKTLLHKLIVAITGEKPDQEKGFAIAFDSLIGRKVRVTIEKQGERSDQQRGGFYSKLRNISPVFEDDDEAPAAPVKKPLPERNAEVNPRGASAEDELPWGED